MKDIYAMTLNFDIEATDDIKALATIAKVSRTDRTALAQMVAMLVAQKLDHMRVPRESDDAEVAQPKGATDGE